MFTTLPDLTPRDSYALWYTSSRNPIPSSYLDAPPNNNPDEQHQHQQQGNNGGPGGTTQQQRRQILERTPLHRLAMDEVYSNRRKANTANFGSTWLKPPGLLKTLHQMREEKREQEEQAEAARREQQVQEMAEAAQAEADGMDAEDVQLDGTQDLDDDIPDAGEDFMMGDGDDDEDEEQDEDEEDEEGDENDGQVDDEAARVERHNDLMAAMMRARDDAYREALIRGDPDGDDMYGGDEELQEEDEGHMLDEDDFVHEEGLLDDEDGDMGDMDANLDDDIPEAESEEGGYEHTDSEAELSSSSDGGHMAAHDQDSDDDDGEGGEHSAQMGVGDMDFGGGPRPRLVRPPQSPTLRGRASLAASNPRHSMELSSLLDESSFMASSPAQQRRARHG